MTDTKLLTYLKSVHAATEDGTTSYPRFIQDQLIKLYKVLSESRDELLQAVQANTGPATAEAHFKLAETLQLVKRLAWMNLTMGTPLYSAVGPLATAMAAGNAVVSLLSPETNAVSSILEAKLAAKLDHFAYFFTRSSSLTDILSVSSLPAPALVIGRTFPSLPDSLPCPLNTSGLSGSTVLIDRLSPAAHQIIAYLALKEAYGVDAALSVDYGRMRGECDGEKSRRAEREQGEGKVVCGEAKGAKEGEGYFLPMIVEQPSLFLCQDLAGPILSFAAFASHEDALVLLSKMDSQMLFLFSDNLHNLNYLAVETGVSSVYMNNLPVSALYEPARNITDLSKYTLTTQIIHPSHAPSTTSKLFAPFTSSRLSALTSLFPRERSLKFIRAKHSNLILRVFFLQGVFISVGTILVCLLGTKGCGAYLEFGYPRRRFFL